MTEFEEPVIRLSKKEIEAQALEFERLKEKKKKKHRKGVKEDLLRLLLKKPMSIKRGLKKESMSQTPKLSKLPPWRKLKRKEQKCFTEYKKVMEYRRRPEIISIVT